MRVLAFPLLILLAGPAFGQDVGQEQASAARPSMGIEVSTPRGPGLLVGFSGNGPLNELREIETRMAELGCPPVRIEGDGDERHIVAMFASTCDEAAAAAFMGEVLSSKYPGLRDLDVTLFPIRGAQN